MRIQLLTLTVLFTATACGSVSSPSDMSDQPHTVAEYLADDKLSSDTIEACRASNAAEARIMRDKEACKNVREAERQRREVAMTKYAEEEKASMDAIREERRKQREARQ